MKTENVLRQCAVTRKIFPRNELFRIVKTKRGKIFFDPEYKILGRGMHFSKEKNIVEKFFHPKKRRMVSHFLQIQIPEKKFLELQDAVISVISKESKMTEN